MEVAESREQASVGPTTGAESTFPNGDRNPFLDDPLIDDDGRSSSLSEIDDVSDNEPSDFEDPIKSDKPVENDSEAETERIEDSPHNIRKHDIVLSAASAGPSPSKLHQSTTLDDVDDEALLADDSPSKPRRSSKNNGLTEDIPDLGDLGDSGLPNSLNKKRKHETVPELGDEEPTKKRRNSIKSDLSDPIDDDTPLSPEPLGNPMDINDDDIPVDEVPESDLPAPPSKGKKGKKGKRKGRRTQDADEEAEGGVEATVEYVADEILGEDEEPAERGDEPDAAEAVLRAEESVKKMSAMDSLATLEKEFATLRDKIYDERISKLNRELEMLTGPNPTHPEYLRQIECVQRYRDAKIKYEQNLYRYRMKSLMHKGLAERSQAHSTYYQRIRDAREWHSSAVSKQFYAIQHDRFKTDELSPHHIIPFPTRRSQQIAHQTAYNQEVSIMAGVAKYVGFPAAPSLMGARPTELDDDLEKMGIPIENRASAPRHSSTIPRTTMSTMSSNAFRSAAEEAFLEQTPWANPQHPIHQQQHQQQQHSQPPRPQGRTFEHPQPSSYATPAAQKRMVDINAPNGSASTIPENASAANSSANNTPYGMEHDLRHQAQGPFHNPDYDVDHRKSGFRSLSSSPLDVRKAQPHLSHALEHRSPITDAPSHNHIFSPPSTRQGLFQPSAALQRETSPSLPPKPVDVVHYRAHQAGISTGTGSNHMPNR
ncbi:unnamed protein product [Penicillium nalgiovense]|uniref:Transcriptional regulatory protein DEP1 n=1 Tax=Penicillium nalgiovense TaxID=60175 RepID=A0A1V6Z3E1_PENNA|nr:hypothetical protein PENNAL_c0004G11076 [Penicillium nalgiovense]CAG7950096.1 unnamed protein product [Penicillium nalgiovense]CAG7975307.1 unnamed protein product [Penicillium nalgiovense]CAG7983689.1 unnamed protein product [Penicillium nalgiovense]CAG8024729.1 unnamed protein product [Penicillium nalgiovense]